MKQTKIRRFTLAALALVLAFALSFAIGSLAVFKRAKALEYRPTEIFSADTGATVGASAGEGDHFTMFTFTESDGSVHYRHDLALKWNAPVEKAASEPAEQAEGAAEYETHRFSMTISFPAISFKTFYIDFESAEENVSKEGKSVNSLVFLYEGGKLKIAVRDASNQPEKDEEEDDWTPETDAAIEIEAATEDIAIALSDENATAAGNFAVTANGLRIGEFTNVGGNFLEYVSTASSSPRDPLTFRAAELNEGADVKQEMLVKSLNGQDFKLTEDDKITDNADPVLVVDELVYAYTLGGRWSLNYEVIDVCDSSVQASRRYAMLGAPEDDVYAKPVSGDYGTLSTSTTVFMPTTDDISSAEEQYVSIYFELDDGRSLKSEEKRAKRIYLSWYAAENAIREIQTDVYVCPKCGNEIGLKEYSGLADDWKCPNPDGIEDHGDVTKDSLTRETAATSFIKVNREKTGPAYIGIVAKEEEGKLANAFADDAILDEDDVDGDGDTAELLASAQYQKAVDDAAYEEVLVNGVATKKLKLSAGDGAYFYLPSLRNLIASESADYRNLRFSVYYKKQSMEVGATASRSTSLRYNALRFEIDEEGKYVFKVIASDASGNAMKYVVDGKLVALTENNVWDVEEIPEFSFEVTYNGATIEDAGEQSLGYCDSTYSVSSFDIVALDGYETEYTLYRLDTTEMTDGVPSYSDLVKNTKKYFDQYPDAFKQIAVFNSDVTEDDKDRWDHTDNRYHWDPDSSLSFVPQEATYYVVMLTVTESRVPGGARPTAYQVIDVRNRLDGRPDPISWLENNVTAVVLFSISAVLLIVIIVLAVVKPSDKKVEEVDLEALKGKKNKQKKE